MSTYDYSVYVLNQISCVEIDSLLLGVCIKPDI